MTFSIDAIASALAQAGLLVDRQGPLPQSAEDIADDSRRAGPGALFVAVAGASDDGHDYLEDAARRGAIAAIVEDASRTPLPALVVRNGRRAAAIAATHAFAQPSEGMRLVGVTGTNGKTTTVNILRHLLDDPAERSASIGTIGVLIGSAGTPMEGGAGLTTPGPVELQRLFRQLCDAGVRRVAMEVSSHALHQRRVEGVRYDAAVFTNITRDHLDYHLTMEAYFAAKATLIDYLRPHGTVVVNADVPAWRALSTDRRRVSFGTGLATHDVHADDVQYTARGSEWTLVLPGERHPTRLPLIGDFNLANALAAAAAAYSLGIPGQRIAERLTSLPQVPGRLEVIHESPLVLRDYAHTPDALERALAAIRPLTRGRLIVVFGAGGDRDRGKRPEMGSAAARGADLAIVTSDNPRTEDPERILDDIVAGMGDAGFERVADRRDAIARALALAGEGDVVLLAGKGHETYQIRGTQKFPFDERAIVRELTTSEART
ncbi:MAG: UDP-N-acetylmuramoyl-L-alanyl-D-glutamate--2,6-diaminopimelate ligase [Gemmatimonadaceae bacterium]|nr:UDP-N-acetylmuramoyl-L-alanyl-D-glutamate--2,6-diaminopimelate ligase [Gemmatimonadaceae bacterium]